MHDHVLLCGADEQLLHTRDLVLRSAGLNVVPVLGVSELSPSVQKQPFDLFVICHSLGADEQREAVLRIRQHGATTPILVLAPTARELPSDGCYRMDAHGGPASLIAACEALLRAPNKDPEWLESLKGRPVEFDIGQGDKGRRLTRSGHSQKSDPAYCTVSETSPQLVGS